MRDGTGVRDGLRDELRDGGMDWRDQLRDWSVCLWPNEWWVSMWVCI